jgi:hypothetical protein
LNDRTRLVDHDTKPPVCGEEGQAMPAGIGIDPALGKARDPARAHLFLQQGGCEAEAFGDDGASICTAPFSNLIGFMYCT